MDGLDLAPMALAAALALLVAAIVSGVRLELAPALDYRRRLQGVRHQLDRELAEHQSRPASVHRHNAHCPACGRFAHVTSSGPRGIRTRCAVHGVRLRVIKRIGRADNPLISLTLVPDQRLSIAPPLVEHIDAMRPTYRLADSLDTLARGIPLQYLRPIAA